jgi:hypothetical protein
MECQLVLDSLSGYLDGGLVESEVRQIEAHLTQCLSCHTVKLELTEIRQAARELPLHTPQRALWARIQSTIEREAVAKSGGKAAVQPGRWAQLLSRRFTLTFPQLAGVSALVVALVTFSFVNLTRQSSTPATPRITDLSAATILGEDELKEKIERRLAALSTRKETWDPEMRELFEHHLAKIDQSLSNCRQMLQANPTDQDHQQMVLALYQEKLQLLDDFERVE